MIKTIATDLDGTLFYPKSRFRLIKSKNKKFLKKFLANPNNNLILVSGRNYTLASKVQKRIGVDRLSMIACNGACIYNNGVIIEENELSKDDIKFLYEYTKKFSDVRIWLIMTNIIPIITVTRDISKSFELIGKLGMNLQFAYYEDYVYGEEHLEEFLNNPNCKFYKFMPCFGLTKSAVEKAKLASKKIYEELGDKYEIMWSSTSIEFMKKGVNKANALKKLLNMLELNEHETAVIGDSGNDIPLFKSFDNSFCMAQAHKSVKKRAKNIIKGVYEIDKYL